MSQIHKILSIFIRRKIWNLLIFIIYIPASPGKELCIPRWTQSPTVAVVWPIKTKIYIEKSSFVVLVKILKDFTIINSAVVTYTLVSSHTVLRLGIWCIRDVFFIEILEWLPTGHPSLTHLLNIVRWPTMNRRVFLTLEIKLLGADIGRLSTDVRPICLDVWSITRTSDDA